MRSPRVDLRLLPLLGLVALAAFILFRSSSVGGANASDHRAAVIAGYPGDYARIVEQANLERDLVVWSAADRTRVAGLVSEFQRHYPKVRLHYEVMPARQMTSKFLALQSQGQQGPDLIWSPAMDLQIKLTNDGYALSYGSPESGNIAPWAVWKDQAWGTTMEPVVMVYNKRLVPPDEVPKSRDELIAFLDRHHGQPAGRIGTYDPRISAFGFLLLIQDRQADRDIWQLTQAMARAHVALFPTADNVIDQVIHGKAAFGYNVPGSYAMDHVRSNPDLGVVLLEDYSLVMSRIAIIPKNAAHANAAKLFIDFLLSAEGQKFLATHFMYSVRTHRSTSEILNDSEIPLRAIRVGPALLVTHDELTRSLILGQWQAAMEQGALRARQ